LNGQLKSELLFQIGILLTNTSILLIKRDLN